MVSARLQNNPTHAAVNLCQKSRDALRVVVVQTSRQERLNHVDGDEQTGRSRVGDWVTGWLETGACVASSEKSIWRKKEKVGGRHKQVCDWIRMAAQVVEDEEELHSDMDTDSWTPVASYRGSGKFKSSEAGRGSGNSGDKGNLEDDSTDDGSKGVHEKIQFNSILFTSDQVYLLWRKKRESKKLKAEMSTVISM
jgi:hypothetical protein